MTTFMPAPSHQHFIDKIPTSTSVNASAMIMNFVGKQYARNNPAPNAINNTPFTEARFFIRHLDGNDRRRF